MSLRLLQVDNDPGAPFPPVDQALAEPDGLLAFGGDLSPQRLLNAYRHGIFPWFSNGEPIRLCLRRISILAYSGETPFLAVSLR